MSADDGPGDREVAHRLFAAEYDDASLEYSESDEERAPNYVVSPTGARINRLFVVGVLTAVESVNEETVRARVVDPTGAFVVYAGQYQPDELAFFERADTPTFVALTGKANAFSPEDSDRVLTSVRPESVNEVDAEARDRWVVTTAEHTLARIGAMADALSREERGDALVDALLAEGIDRSTATGVSLALDHYEVGADYLGELRTAALDALGVVADERDEVRSIELSPDDHSGEHDADVLAERSPLGPSVLATGDEAATSGDSGGDDAVIDDSTDDGDDAEPATVTASSGGAETASDDEAAATADAGTTADPEISRSGDSGSGSGSTHDSDADGTDETTSTTADTEPSEGSGASSLGNFEPGADSSTAADDEPGSETDESAASDDDTVAETGDSTAPDDSVADEDPTAPDDSVAETEDSTAPDDAPTPPETDEMYEFDEEEREEIKEEHGLEFSTGTEVDAASEADSSTSGEDVPDEPNRHDPDEPGDDASVASSESEGTTEEPATDDVDNDPADSDEDVADQDADAEDATDEDAIDEDAEDEDADIDDVLMDRMDDLDDGDGADRTALVDEVAAATGASEDDIEDAIEDALMSGQCYEPDDGLLKPI